MARMHLGRRSRGLAVGALGLMLLAPAGASAQSTKPAVTTGAAADVTIQTATLTGSVDPNGAQTTYFFQIGPTSLYGSQTAAAAAGRSAAGEAGTPPGGARAPATRYPYPPGPPHRHRLGKGSGRPAKAKAKPPHR